MGKNPQSASPYLLFSVLSDEIQVLMPVAFYKDKEAAWNCGSTPLHRGGDELYVHGQMRRRNPLYRVDKLSGEASESA